MADNSADGFIMRDGKPIALEDVEGMFSLARDGNAKGRPSPAQAYFQKALDLSDTCQMKAFCRLAIGQVKEKQEDYAGAIDWYLKAFLMEPGRGDTWYLLHNNLGDCMNRLGRQAEAAATPGWLPRWPKRQPLTSPPISTSRRRSTATESSRRPSSSCATWATERSANVRAGAGLTSSCRRGPASGRL